VKEDVDDIEENGRHFGAADNAMMWDRSFEALISYWQYQSTDSTKTNRKEECGEDIARTCFFSCHEQRDDHLFATMVR
jgi:hypothetical protein